MHTPLAVRSVALLCLVLALGTVVSWSASATAFEPRTFRSETDERRYKSMVEELRCLVCQNQTIAASDADLAKDLRDRVHSMIEDGRSDQEIIDFMVQRYGDFVLYRPPLKLSTVLLWVGPFTLGLLALVMLVLMVRRAGVARRAAGAPMSSDDHERAMQLLGDDGASRREPE